MYYFIFVSTFFMGYVKRFFTCSSLWYVTIIMLYYEFYRSSYNPISNKLIAFVSLIHYIIILVELLYKRRFLVYIIYNCIIIIQIFINLYEHQETLLCFLINYKMFILIIFSFNDTSKLYMNASHITSRKINLIHYTNTWNSFQLWTICCNIFTVL